MNLCETGTQHWTRRCLAKKTHQVLIHNLCFDCWHDNPQWDWLDPLDERIKYMIAEDEAPFDSYNWHVPSVSSDMTFRNIDYDQSKVSEANADEEPVSPSSFLPDIPKHSSSLRKSIMDAANNVNVFGKRRTLLAPTDVNISPRSQAEDLADAFPKPPSKKQRKGTRAQVPSTTVTSSPPIPPRHPNRIPPPAIPPRHTHRTLLLPTTTPLQITTITPTSPTILALDAADPLLASTLQSGETARSTRTHLRTLRDRPTPAYQRQKQVAEMRVRLKEMGRNESALFQGGLRFRAARVRRG